MCRSAPLKLVGEHGTHNLVERVEGAKRCLDHRPQPLTVVRVEAQRLTRVKIQQLLLKPSFVRAAQQPHVHVVVAESSQVVPDLGSALALAKARHGDQMPSMLSFITGPSRTGDIERILVLGAHGPKELYLVLVG